jgi:uncharacterized membrane protein YjdF
VKILNFIHFYTSIKYGELLRDFDAVVFVELLVNIIYKISMKQLAENNYVFSFLWVFIFLLGEHENNCPKKYLQEKV